MKVKFKKINKTAKSPTYANKGDAGLDFFCTEFEVDNSANIITYHTGIILEIPKGYVGLLFQRSSIVKYQLRLANSVGVIDSGYRGEILFKFDMRGQAVYSIGDKIGQIVIIPYPEIELQESRLTKTERGKLGFGSSGY